LLLLLLLLLLPLLFLLLLLLMFFARVCACTASALHVPRASIRVVRSPVRIWPH